MSKTDTQIFRLTDFEQFMKEADERQLLQETLRTVEGIRIRQEHLEGDVSELESTTYREIKPKLQEIKINQQNCLKGREEKKVDMKYVFIGLLAVWQIVNSYIKW